MPFAPSSPPYTVRGPPVAAVYLVSVDETDVPPSIDAEARGLDSPAAPGADAAWRAAGAWVRLGSWLRRPEVLVPLVITVVSLFLHVWRLGTPDQFIPLDERHYIPDARDVLRFGTESDVRVPSEDGAFVVHPPLAKWFIAAGMRIFGQNSEFGWRFFGAALGALGSLILYLIAKRLWGSRSTAAVAGILLAVEGLWFVQSRVAMLDIYTAFFGLLALWLLLEDRARAGPGARGPRWWRIGSGVAVGLALASKWGAFPTLGVLLGLAAVWELAPVLGPPLRRLWVSMGPDGARATFPEMPEEPTRWFRRSAAVGVTFVALPVAVYVATFTPWFLDSHRYLPPRCAGKGQVRGWVCYQREVYDFHRNLAKYDKDGKPKHPYYGEVWSWPWIGRPVVHYYQTDGEGQSQKDSEVVGLPNPVIWGAGFVAVVPLSLWAWRGHRRKRARGWRRLFGKAPPGGVPASAVPDGATIEAERGPPLDWGMLEQAAQLRRPPGDLPAPPAIAGARATWEDGGGASGGDRVAGLILVLILANYLPYLLTGIFGRPAFLFYATPLVPFLVLGVTHVLHRIRESRSSGRVIVVAYVALAVVSFAWFYPVLAAATIPHNGTFGWQGRMWLGGFRFHGRYLGDCLLDATFRLKKLCWV